MNDPNRPIPSENQPPVPPPVHSPGLLLTVLLLGIAIGLMVTLVAGNHQLLFREAVRHFDFGVGAGVGIVLLVAIINFIVNAADKTRNNL